MGFAEINDEIRTKKASAGGAWVKLNRKEHGRLKGTLVDIQKRKKIFEETVVTNKDGDPRYEWVVTLNTEDGVKKWAANESGQWAIRGALKEGQQLREGGQFEVFVLEDPPKKTSQAEYKVIYTDPVGESPFDGADDEPPY